MMDRANPKDGGRLSRYKDRGDKTPRVLITGSSGGIGFELARSFGKRGCELIINGSHEQRLLSAKERLEKEFARPVTAVVEDLSLPGGAKALHRQVANAGIGVDILVNNAGMGLLAATDEIDFEADESLMRLNMIALVQLCKLYLPEMYRRGSGKILNIASVAAFQPGPYNSTYFASKAFVLSYSRAIRYEARRRGVDVCALCPNSTKTGFFDKEGIRTPPMSAEPQAVAEYAYHKLTRNKAVIVPGLVNNLTRAIPSGVKMRLVAMMKDMGKE
ncbi:MAG: SDR family NAD(P)-dependent oxidoreductase [Peptococcaceae bacterium]|jgi:short-subunit dehydrogenase|nr:SDR family NAD(P)-dependent oxidoreductase [Peptococcaceae bacterium]